MAAFAAVLALSGPCHWSVSLAPSPPGLPPCDEGIESVYCETFAVWRSRFRTLPEDRHDELSERSDQILCVADARLDNRNELLRELAEYRLSATASDTDIIRAACSHWGAGAAAHLLGDFAFVSWDRRSRVAYGASDPLGVRTLRYSLVGNHLAVGSRARPVASLRPTGAEPEPEFFSRYLRGDHRVWSDRTAFRGVRRVPAGHQLEATARGVRVSAYHSTTVPAVRPAKTPDEWAERFRVALTEAVCCRLRSRGSVAVSLSGGLDSTAVTVLAAREVQGRHGAPLYAVSSVFPGVGAADERDHIASVLAMYPGIRPIWTNGLQGLAFGSQTRGDGYVPDEVDADVDRLKLSDRASAAQAAGCSVVLSGHWADQLLGGYSATDLLLRLPPSRVPGEAPHFVTAAGGLMAVMRRIAVTTLRQGERRRLAGVPRAGSPRLKQLLGGYSTGLKVALAQWHDHVGTEYRVPFLDLRVVRTVLAMPAHALLQNGVSKWCLRHGLRECLPDVVRTRVGGANFTSLTHRGFMMALPRLRASLHTSQAVDRGWVRRVDIERQLTSYATLPGRVARQQIVRWLTADEWLRQRF